MSAAVRYCRKCGAALPDGATFCPTCGTPVAVSGTTSETTTPPRRYEYRHEKQEKREKGEKQEKHEKGEKGEKGRSGDVTGALVGGLILIWLGVTFYLQQIGTISSNNWWAYFLFGLGAILILQGVIIYARGRHGMGPIIGGAILMFLGVAFITNATTNLWPLILVIIGVAVIAGGITSRRRVPSPSGESGRK